MSKLRNIRIDITQPIKLDVNMDVNQLSLYVGTNGSGKTLVLKSQWAMQMMVNRFLLATELRMSENGITEYCQYVMDNTFEEQNFDGFIYVEFENYSLKVFFEKGKITNTEYSNPDEARSNGVPIFMSKDMRTFDSVKRYLETRSMIGFEGSLASGTPEMLSQLSKFYRLYDITYVELLRHKLVEGFVIPDMMHKHFENFELEKLGMVTFGYDKEANNFFFTDKDGRNRFLTTLSAGEQSMINMTLGVYLQ